MKNSDLADLVSERRYEGSLRRLFDSRAGEWVTVAELFRVESSAVVTWLADPLDRNGYAVVLFFDADSQWSMTALYNVGRLT